MIRFIIRLAGLPQLPGNRQPTIGHTSIGMLIRMAMRTDVFIISHRNGCLSFVHQGYGPLLRQIAPLFVTRTPELDGSAFSTAVGDRARACQGLDTARLRKTLAVIPEL